MNIFLFIIIIIALFFSLIIFYFLKTSIKNLSVGEVNKNIFKQQFDEISKDFKIGLINQKDFALMKNELSRRVLKYSLKNNIDEKEENKLWANFIKLISDKRYKIALNQHNSPVN